MAKLIWTPQRRKLWALTEPEDVVVIDAIDRVIPYFTERDAYTAQNLQTYYFNSGGLLSDMDLRNVNGILTMKGYHRIVLEDGRSSAYTVLGGPEKAKIRAEIRDKLNDLTVAERSIHINQCWRSILAQPAPVIRSKKPPFRTVYRGDHQEAVPLRHLSDSIVSPDPPPNPVRITKDGQSKRVTRNRLPQRETAGWSQEQVIPNKPTTPMPDETLLRDDCAASPTHSEYDAIKAEIETIRKELGRLTSLWHEYASTG